MRPNRQRERRNAQEDAMGARVSIGDFAGGPASAEKRSATYPWGDASGMTVAHTVAWVNAELMKNVSEIGQLRRLWAASPNG